ncbi:epimerase family protein SDR39U1, partial [Carcharodon carcharias]|uniref:epimerase family protein SDR39U1 n=1 Tax=Carcharodon carcharias TaxID=13397 RepID=UPI001B7F47ED
IGGGTGFIGGALTQLLRNKGHEVGHISRNPGAGITWTGLAARGLPPCDAVVNLAGENVLNPFRRWNRKFKDEVFSSRVDTTRTLARAIVETRTPPQVWLLVSAVGFYQPSLTVEYDEDSPGGDADFFSRLVRDWEGAARLPEHTAQLVRQAVVRSGVVLGKDGGALKQMIWPFWLGVGGAIGSGRQSFPWIHVEDMSGILAHALENDSVRGILNGVAPTPCTSRQFAAALGSSLGRPAVLPVPALALEAVLGAERAVMLLEGQRVVPRRTLESGYKYRYPELAAALDNVVSGG